ncbi:GNAT family N-acetyltransferase [Nonomuraea longicatena]|uniref:N-acetyltransferase domain-containing protein n=1 Tax=Nonomuraea longicatena TaxID=83682 RepID=A0ABN1NLR7_9ACTN
MRSDGELLRLESDVLGIPEDGEAVVAQTSDGHTFAVLGAGLDPGFTEADALRLRPGGDGDPSYLVVPPLRHEFPVEVLDHRHAERVRGLRPGNWTAEEWAELLDGGAGAPWTMVVEDGQVVSICHTPRRTAAGAEAGTWTAPGHRGRGHAAATTVAWARILAPDCPLLFYSTSADNRSSQRVAERLGLRPLGRLWRVPLT